MRYEKGHKAGTRLKILETASREFRKQGIQGVGLADIMSQAGLTHGGFYSHFTSKDDLIRQSLGNPLPPEKSTPFRHEGKVRPVEDIIRCYLSPKHRDHPEKGCPAAALVEEMVRQPKATREVFTKVLQERVDDIALGLSKKLSKEARQKKAYAIFSTIMGSIQLARTVTDPEVSEQILEAGIESALHLAKA